MAVESTFVRHGHALRVALRITWLDTLMDMPSASRAAVHITREVTVRL